MALSSSRLGLSAKIDLVEGTGADAVPVDYKRGRPPSNGEVAYEPEGVQLCAYGLLLREHGYTCDRGVLYFAQARSRGPAEGRGDVVLASLGRSLKEAEGGATVV